MLKRFFLILLIVLSLTSLSYSRDLRALKIKRFLDRYPWSPLRGHEGEIIYCADKFGIDYRLYVAIAGAESTYGKNYPKNNKNLTGYKSGTTKFSSIFQNIYETSKLIGTSAYYRKYRRSQNIWDLIRVYKSVPPFKHYYRNMRYALDQIHAISIDDKRAQSSVQIIALD
jgi:hypothetical protein